MLAKCCRSWRSAMLLLIGALLVVSASAHPMGNFSVNHYSRIEMQSDRILVHYFIDLAEIPTYQELQQGNLAPSPGVPINSKDPAITSYVATRGEELGRGLSLALDGRAVALRSISSGVIFPAGAGGLPTMKMGFVYAADYPVNLDRAHMSLHYSDGNYAGHSGWKEIIATLAAGTLIETSVPTTDRSDELSNYPTDLLNSPPQALDANVEVSLPALPPAGSNSEVTRSVFSHTARVRDTVSAPGLSQKTITPVTHASTQSPMRMVTPAKPASAAATVPIRLEANQQQTPRSRFTELITEQHLSLWFLLTAAIIAIGLGALHALEPGHGKTIVAAYLVGSRGTARHAVLLGLIVTASHTAGVLGLGAITLYASRYIVPEQLYPWLGVFSGVTIAVLGCYMFLRRLTGAATDHSHEPGSQHAHRFFFMRKGGEGEEASESLIEAGVQKQVSLTQLFTLGVTGGIIPCPAALIVLLSAFALHRVALGFFLIVAFSVGLAAVLIGFGMAMVYARRFMTRWQIEGPLTKRWLPLASSAFITLLGAGLAVQAFATTRFSFPTLSKERIGPVLFVTGLGLILGMRHSTDADHVVAISTIVSKQRSIRNAVFIGSVWGLGHTITIFIVGSLIILFGIEIPPRIGLSMEFSVALMLIVLGVLNLTGVMQRITTYFTRQSRANALELSPSIRPSNFVASFGVYQCVRPLIIGLVHGLAGSAAVALLVLSTIHNPYWATVYLVIFGIGTMIGMMCMTAAIAVPLTYAGDRVEHLSRYFGVASGLASLCFGSFLVYQLGFLGGLFTSHPQWTPQ